MSILEMQNRYTDFALGLLLFLIFKPTNSRRSCGNVEIPALFRDFQRRLENRETCIWFSDFSTDCHFHNCAVSSLRSLFRGNAYSARKRAPRATLPRRGVRNEGIP
jgi:hypothetical protein